MCSVKGILFSSVFNMSTRYDIIKHYDIVSNNKDRISHFLIKNREKIKVKHGIITYTVDISKLSCQCSSGMCDHILYVLTHVLGIGIKFLLVMDRHKDKYEDVIIKYIKKNINDKDVGNELNIYIEKELQNTECGMCMSKITNVFNSFQCSECKKFTHLKCQNRWFERNETCIYCMQKIKDKHLL